MTTTAIPLDLAALRELAPGTGRVQSVAVREHETLLGLGYPNELHLVVSLPALPQPGLASDGSLQGVRPLAVRMSNRRASLDCSLLGTSRSGPERIRISIAQALGLCATGVHAVFCTE